jgi:hypothetical protein
MWREDRGPSRNRGEWYSICATSCRNSRGFALSGTQYRRAFGDTPREIVVKTVAEASSRFNRGQTGSFSKLLKT